ncbi:uncharacterized protein [Cherax quadricarinatus]|uniref:uncharacterized protein isoform X2 n=1 Tax=Cherax quadricarinatus TaxID=27406 RepID=UPI00387E6921
MPLTFNAGNVKTISGACKIIEIILLLVTMMIQRTTGSLFGGEDAHIFSMGLLVTGLIITPILLLCYIVDRDITRSSVIVRACAEHHSLWIIPDCCCTLFDILGKSHCC